MVVGYEHHFGSQEFGWIRYIQHTAIISNRETYNNRSYIRHVRVCTTSWSSCLMVLHYGITTPHIQVERQHSWSADSPFRLIHKWNSACPTSWLPSKSRASHLWRPFRLVHKSGVLPPSSSHSSDLSKSGNTSLLPQSPEHNIIPE